MCSHPNKAEINRELVLGKPKRGIARQNGLTPDAVERHADTHLSRSLLSGAERKAEREAIDLYAVALRTMEAANEIFEQSEGELSLKSLDRVQAGIKTAILVETARLDHELKKLMLQVGVQTVEGLAEWIANRQKDLQPLEPNEAAELMAQAVGVLLDAHPGLTTVFLNRVPQLTQAIGGYDGEEVACADEANAD